MMIQVLYRSILLTAAVFSFSAMSLGQTAEVTGIVKDSAQAVVSNAAINLVNEDTGIKRSTTTNDLGYYSISFVTPGNYKITVQATGFQTVSRIGIKLEVAQVARLDFSLEIGGVEAQIMIEEGVPILQTDSAALGRTTSEQFIVSLPLSSRNFTQTWRSRPALPSNFPTPEKSAETLKIFQPTEPGQRSTISSLTEWMPTILPKTRPLDSAPKSAWRFQRRIRFRSLRRRLDCMMPVKVVAPARI